jgi:peptide/nickel transport system substrate-binding protein
MRNGSLDASMSFIPRIAYKRPAGVRTWYEKAPYFVPGAMPMIIVNTMKEPLNDRVFRRAMATAIDYVAIRMFAVSNYTSEIKSGLIMPTSLEGVTSMKKIVRSTASIFLFVMRKDLSQ